MRMYIIGSVGSGKTTLGKKAALAYNIPRFETDNFVWERKPGGDVRNSEEKRNKLFQEAVELEEWVIEGVHIGWTDQGLEKADWIIFLDFPPRTRTWRIIKRYIKQTLMLEKANYRQTLRIFFKMFGWNRYFEETMRPEFLEKLQHCQAKTTIVKTQGELKELKVNNKWEIRGP
ncbi:DNA topology modulation protein FlaR [Planomicrobium chinense]|uniref:DNA topology modulation protein FlaR n=1 Tax=Planococcus chinensis TaxID=272917 RepID=UPI001CC604D8|nr:DNA topology modulation protein FlaR [Planococcus chinensis]MBZ5201893.1 DNA topology modulation protein FlaR [Planococcus chinensis]